MKAAIGHAHRQERRHDGMLACQPCREYPEHGTLGAYTNWRCRCRPCQDGYMAARVEYWENRPREGYATKRYHANVQIIRSMKIGRTCADCPLICTVENFPVFDWDHRPGTEKKFNLSAPGGRAQKTVQAEVAKCEVVCANCHRMRGFTRKQHIAEVPGLPGARWRKASKEVG